MSHRDGGSVAIAIQIDIPGVTLKRYDEAVEIAGLVPGGPLPSGALFHWVAKANGGIQIVNVWESREGYDQFAARQAEIIEEIGVDLASIKVEFVEVHSYHGRIGSRS
jgi:predicted NUDIX family NTP pyrophosphohydrolase